MSNKILNLLWKWLLTANLTNSLRACNVLPFLPIKIGLCVESMVILMTWSSNLVLTVLSISKALSHRLQR